MIKSPLLDDDTLLQLLNVEASSQSTTFTADKPTSSPSSLLNASLNLFKSAVKEVLASHYSADDSRLQANLATFTANLNVVHVLTLVIVVMGSVLLIIIVVIIVRYRRLRKQRTRQLQPMAMSTTGQQPATEMEIVNLNEIAGMPRQSPAVSNPLYEASPAAGSAVTTSSLTGLFASPSSFNPRPTRHL